MKIDNLITRWALWLSHLLIFWIKSPFKLHNPFKNKIVVRIWWNVNPLYEHLLKGATKVIDINISDSYIWRPNLVTIKADAHDLSMIEDCSVDCVISSHTLEHLTNPIKAITEWLRIMKSWALMYHCIPYYKKTFDQKRCTTKIEHFIEDFNNKTSLSDRTHTEEFVENYDISMDKSFNTKEEWLENFNLNPQIYTHYHVFDMDNVKGLFEYCWLSTEKMFFSWVSIEYFWFKK